MTGPALETRRDQLFLLKQGFEDPAYPGQRFYCWHCAALEGALTYFPELTEKIEIMRVSWPRPRQEIVELVGVENQSVPLLILADSERTEGASINRFRGVSFVSGVEDILQALSLRHGIPMPHP
jgi:hypothetical protein